MRRLKVILFGLIVVSASCKTTQKATAEPDEWVVIITFHDRNEASTRIMDIIFRAKPYDQQVSFAEKLSENFKVIKCRFGRVSGKAIDQLNGDLLGIVEVVDVNIEPITKPAEK